jgi:hypothetical protein
LENQVQTCRQCGNPLEDHVITFDPDEFATAGRYNPDGRLALCGYQPTHYDPISNMVEFVGPFSDNTYRALVAGYEVPYLRLWLQKGTEDQWTLQLSGPGTATYLKDAPDQEVRRWVSYLATAMAIAAGFTSFGGASRTIHPFSVKAYTIELTGESGGIVSEPKGI